MEARGVEPSVQKLDGVYLYDLDSLRSIAERTLTVRKQASEKCCQLIERHVQEFQSWKERTQTLNFHRLLLLLDCLKTDCR